MPEASQTITPEHHPDLRWLALLATGSTGADIERLVRDVRRKSRRQQRSLTWGDLEHALLAGQVKLSDDVRWRTAIHEVGHAIAFCDMGIAEVITASIGMGGMGQVVSRQCQHLLQTQDWLMRSIACMLAGRTAELLIFGDTVAGAGGYDDSDLARATEHAVAAETRLGFSNHQPLLYRSVAGSINELSLDRHLADRVNGRLMEAEAMARRLLENRRDVLVAIATQLKDVGVMTGEEITRLLIASPGATDLTKADGELRNHDSDRRHCDSPFPNADSEVAEIDSDLRKFDSCAGTGTVGTSSGHLPSEAARDGED